MIFGGRPRLAWRSWGVSPFIVGHVLNHASVTRGSVTSRVYARYSYEREKREALALWASRLVAVVGGGQAAGVIPLRRDSN